MTSVVDILKNHLNDETISALSAKVGADTQSTKSAITAALPLILGAVAGHTSKGQIPSFLTAFLDKNNDGSILDDLLRSVMGGGLSGANDSVISGLFGKNRNTIEKGVSQTSGLPSDIVSKLIPLLIPIVMSALSKARNAQGVDAQDAKAFGGMINKEVQSARQNAPQAKDLFSQILDRDGDGNIMDDVAEMGSGVLGKLFR